MGLHGIKKSVMISVRAIFEALHSLSGDLREDTVGGPEGRLGDSRKGYWWAKRGGLGLISKLRFKVFFVYISGGTVLGHTY